MSRDQLINSIEDGLTYLKKSEGFTLIRASTLITIPEFLSCQNSEFFVLKRFLIDSISELDSLYSDLLLAMFAIQPLYSDIRLLKERRKIYQKKNNITLDTLIITEKALIRDLAKIIWRKGNNLNLEKLEDIDNNAIS